MNPKAVDDVFRTIRYLRFKGRIEPGITSAPNELLDHIESLSRAIHLEDAEAEWAHVLDDAEFCQKHCRSLRKEANCARSLQETSGSRAEDRINRRDSLSPKSQPSHRPSSCYNIRRTLGEPSTLSRGLSLSLP